MSEEATIDSLVQQNLKVRVVFKDNEIPAEAELEELPSIAKVNDDYQGTVGVKRRFWLRLGSAVVVICTVSVGSWLLVQSKAIEPIPQNAVAIESAINAELTELDVKVAQSEAATITETQDKNNNFGPLEDSISEEGQSKATDLMSIESINQPVNTAKVTQGDSILSHASTAAVSPLVLEEAVSRTGSANELAEDQVLQSTDQAMATDLTVAASSPVDVPAYDENVSVYSTQIVRALFTKNVLRREPVNTIENPLQLIGPRGGRVYFFNEFKNMKGESVTHIWRWNSKKIAQIHTEIRGNRWRFYSSKYIPRSKPGLWEVEVVDRQGKALVKGRFMVAES